MESALALEVDVLGASARRYSDSNMYPQQPRRGRPRGGRARARARSRVAGVIFFKTNAGTRVSAAPAGSELPRARPNSVPRVSLRSSVAYCAALLGPKGRTWCCCVSIHVCCRR